MELFVARFREARETQVFTASIGMRDPHRDAVVVRVPIDAFVRDIESMLVAIEQRHEPLDVTIQSGLTAVTNPTAAPVAGWVNAPLVFVVTGPSQKFEHLDLAFALPSASLKIAPAKNTRFTQSGSSLGACVTTLPDVVHSAGLACHRAAAARTSVALAVAPALRSGRQNARTELELPVIWMPRIGFA